MGGGEVVLGVGLGKDGVLEERVVVQPDVAIHIRLNCPSLIRDGGLELPGCWMAALRKAIPQLPVTPLDVASGDRA